MPNLQLLMTTVTVALVLTFATSAQAVQEKQDDPLGTARRADEVLNVWPAKPLGDQRKVGKEQDFTKTTDKLIAGKRIIKLGNVATPEIHIFHPPEEKRNGAAVVICPGGGFHILAWDLEGTEVATWLNSIGVTAIVLKYRVPTTSAKQKWLAPVQDTQRAISLVRANADKWKLDTQRVGVLGFSAGGRTAAVTSYGGKRFYETIDATDEASCQPDFSILIYAAWMANEDGELQEDLNVTEKSPPAFMAHAFDDFVDVENPLVLMGALKKAKVASELHIFDRGGHGYGLRSIEDQPVTRWPNQCAEWMKVKGFLKK